MPDIIGGNGYRWRGRSIRTIHKDNVTCVTMPRKDSIIMTPVSVLAGAHYQVTITASKNSGNGSILVNFFGGKNFDGSAISINVFNTEMREYTVSVPVPKFPPNLPIYLRVWRPDNASGNVFIKIIQYVLINGSASILRNPALPKKQKSNGKVLKDKIKNIKVEEILNKQAPIRKKTILYFVTRIDQRRVFQNIEEDNNINQYYLGPPPRKIENSIMHVYENYDAYKLNNKIYADSIAEYQKAINNISPDIFVCGSIPNFDKLKVLEKTKKVFVSHGVIGDHARLLYENFKTRMTWGGCDLYCGAGREFGNFVNFMTPGEHNILTNALPQLDILYDKTLDNVFINKQAEKYILFAGFGGTRRSDFTYHNEDYYRTAVLLGRIARKNNWFVIIKPRLAPGSDLKFVQKCEETSKYADEYAQLYEDKNVCMAHKLENIYKYFFADVVVTNGCSTVEIEASCVKKPLVIVRTKVDDEQYDPFKTVAYGACEIVKSDDAACLEEKIIQSLTKDYSENIKNLLKYHDIVFDGKMSKRAQEAIFELLKNNKGK